MDSRETVRTWTLAVLTAGAAWLLWLSGVTRPLDQSVSDLLLRIPVPTAEVTVPFAAVVIDDASLAGGGPPPWPRTEMAGLIDAVVAHGARAVVLDAILSEPGDPAGDDALESELARVPSVLAAVLLPRGTWLLPLDRFGGARRAAHAQAEIGTDGVVRELSATKQAGDLSLPALSIAAARLAGWRGAVEPGQSIRPDLRHGLRSIPTLSARELLRSDGAVASLTDMVVFIGYTAAGAGDRYVVPAGGRGRPTPGVLLHAAAATAIVADLLLREAPAWLVLALCLCAAASVQVLRSRLGRLSVPWLAVVLAATVVVTQILLWVDGLVLPTMPLWAAVLFSAAGREAAESFEAQRETDAVLRSLFEQRPQESPIPRGVGGRLQLARTLQRNIARDGELRKALLDGLHEGVVLWDPAGRPILANRSALELWERAPTMDELAPPGSDADHGAPEWRREIERNGRHLEVEMRPIESGRLGLLRDVTAARELERSRREMQRLVSHELKTPLSSIAGFGSMIETYDLSRDEQVRVAGLIRGEADRLADMVRTFLDLERLGIGDGKDRWQPVDLGELVSQRCAVLEAAADEAGQVLRFDRRSDCRVTGSEELLARLIDNLVGNAIKYCPPGSTIEVSTRRRGKTAILEVSDPGPGIGPEALPHVFERFYRVPGSTASGSGLGLALVKEIADQHRARVAVTSKVGSGSTFTAEFPCVDRGEEA